MWKLSIEDDQANKTVVSLVRDEYTLGRAETNSVRLTERNVSRTHARLRRLGREWQLEDLASYNGVFVNGRRVVGTQVLEHGDLAQIGDYRLTVVDDTIRGRDGDLAATVPAGPRGGSLLDQPDRLVMLVGPTPGVEFPLIPKTLVIGRGDECDITLSHSSVSRSHAEVRPLADGRYEIVDRNSANGVRVNGVELDRSLLDARDTVELGDVVLKFIPAGQIYRPSPEESQQLVTLASAAPRAPQSPPPGRGLRLLLFGMLIGLVVAALAAYGLRRTALLAPEPQRIVGSSQDPADVMAQARALLDTGDLLGAHTKAQEIPESSNARESRTFKDIEAAWADAMLAAAESATTLARKRELYNAVATTSTVDPARRGRATDAIAKLDAATLDVNELPTHGGGVPTPPRDADPSNAETPTAQTGARRAVRPSQSASSASRKPTPLRVQRVRTGTQDTGTAP